jgi:hypothetical protein
MTDEILAVASYYDKTTAVLCIPQAASILALEVPYLLKWTQSLATLLLADSFIFAKTTSSADTYAQLEVGMGRETDHGQAYPITGR